MHPCVRHPDALEMRLVIAGQQPGGLTVVAHGIRLEALLHEAARGRLVSGRHGTCGVAQAGPVHRGAGVRRDGSCNTR